MAKNANHITRSDLIANREHQPGYKERARNEAFGIYRPLTEASKAEVTAVLAKATPAVEAYLAKERGTAPIAQLIMREEFGVTFLMRGKVRRAMRFGLLERGFVLGGMMERVENHNQKNGNDLHIPIDGCGWYGEKSRTMVARLAASPGLQVLFNQKPIIDDLLIASKAGGLQVSEPDHVSLFKYGRYRDNMDLSEMQQNEASDIVRGHFQEARVTELILDSLVIGDSYSQPKEVA